MKLKDIMKPENGEGTVCCGLDQEREVYFISSEEVRELPERIPVIDCRNRKVGEIKREFLLAVLQSAGDAAVTTLMDTFEEGIVALDENGIIYYANEMYSKILGVPVGKILGRSMYKIEPHAALLSVLETKKPMKLAHQYVRTLDRHVSCRITPIYRNGVFCGARSVFSDATEIVKLNEEIQRVSQVAMDLRHQVDAMDRSHGMELVGESPAFSRLISKVNVVAATDAPVLLRGENGTGKEVIAKLIHAGSRRADRPLITVNCASIPENLVESELFGYEEGAFTGAAKGGRMGKFEMASGGTLFLDEIGDMPISMQTKLLRAIQENEIEKVGGRNVKVDVRLITATNQPLEQMIEEKTFRRDLYYRINTVTLRVPALRERKEDILLFANHFLKKYNEKYDRAVTFSADVLRWFLEHSWPGNVREMKNCIENGVILCGSGKFDLNWLIQYREEREVGDIDGKEKTAASTSGMKTLLDGELRGELHGEEALREILNGTLNGTLHETLHETMNRVEAAVFRMALQSCEGSRAQAMKLLGLSRRTFYRKLAEHGINGEKGKRL